METRKRIQAVVILNIILISIFLVGLSNMQSHLVGLAALFLPIMLIVNYLIIRKRIDIPPAKIMGDKNHTSTFSLYAYAVVLFVGAAYGLIAIYQDEIPRDVAFLLIVPLFLGVYFLRLARKGRIEAKKIDGSL